MGRTSAIAIATLTVTFAPEGAAQSAAAPGAACERLRLEYALSARLKLVDTPKGKGDGIYAIGPGRMVLEAGVSRSGQPSGAVRLLAMSARQDFTIHAKTLFWSTTVVTRAGTRVTPNSAGSAGEGILSNGRLVWTSKIRGFRTDGTMRCEGMCGRFGTPPSGLSTLAIPPANVELKPFQFSKDGKRFEMPFTLTTKTDMPRQTAYVELQGREVKRACVALRSPGRSESVKQRE